MSTTMYPGEDDFTYEEVPLERLTALDLRDEARDHEREAEPEDGPLQAFIIRIDNHAEAAQALYCPKYGRLGIAWGG